MTLLFVVLIGSLALAWKSRRASAATARRLALLPAIAIFSANLSRAQFPVVLEDWGCGSAAEISNANPAVVTCNTPHNLPAKTQAGMTWRYNVKGATGPWAPVNGTRDITVLDERRFSINVDTRGFGAFSGQQIDLVRANHEGADLTSPILGGNVATARVNAQNQFEITVPKGYDSTANTLYCRVTPISSIEVASGEATVTTSRALPKDFGPVAGREVHFRGTTDERLNSLRYLNKWPDRPHYISWINNELTQFKAKVNVPDGTYAPPAGGASAVLCPPNAFKFLFLPRNPGGYPYPGGRSSNYAKSGPIPLSANRLEFWINWDRTAPRNPKNSWIGSIGTYAKAPEDTDPRAERFHFYHYYNPNVYAGRWIKFIINNTPHHCRSAPGNTGFWNNPTRHGWPYYTSPLYDRMPFDYLPNLTAFYVDGGPGGSPENEQHALVSPILFKQVPNEPDSYVTTITATWAPERFNGKGPGYEVGFGTPKYSGDSFDVRYSTNGSLKTAGFSSGKDGGTLRGTYDAYLNIIWISPQMQEQPMLWVGIRPKAQVLGVSKPGVSPIVISTRVPLGMVDGDLVSVSGVTGNTAANVQRAPVTNLPLVYWQLNYGLQRINVASEVATVELSQPHGLVAGQVVEVYGSQNATLGRLPNKYYTVQATPTPLTFTFNAPKVPDGVYDKSATNTEVLSVRPLPAVSVPGSGNGDYGAGCETKALCSGGGSLVSVEEYKNFTEVSIEQSPTLAPPPAKENPPDRGVEPIRPDPRKKLGDK